MSIMEQKMQEQIEGSLHDQEQLALTSVSYCKRNNKLKFKI